MHWKCRYHNSVQSTSDQAHTQYHQSQQKQNNAGHEQRKNNLSGLISNPADVNSFYTVK